MKHSLLIKNAAVLTGTSLVLRALGMIFRVWMTNIIGAEGIGLYQLIISIYVFASAFATTGICTAVTRLTAELGAKGQSSPKIMRRGVLATVILAAVSMLALVVFSKEIAVYLLKDSRAELALKMLGLGIPFVGLCSVIRGYFLAKRKTLSSSLGQLIEQGVRIAAVMALVSLVEGKGTEYSVAAIILGDAIAEAVGCLFMYIIYRYESHKSNLRPVLNLPITRKLIHIALPITLGKYTHTALRTVENLMVPTMLALYNSDRASSVAWFGMIKGMAIPLLFFPASFLTAFSTLLIPEISEALELGHRYKLRSGAERAIGITVIISVFISGAFYLLGNEISALVYPEENIAPLLISLSPLVPFMYLECVCDGILKGLDQQKHSFIYSVLDSVSRIALIWLLLPKYGMQGFIWIMVYSNLLTSLLNIRRLLKVTGTPVNIGSWILKPLVALIIGIGIASLSMSGAEGDILRLIIGFFSLLFSYALVLFFWGELKIVRGII